MVPAKELLSVAPFALFLSVSNTKRFQAKDGSDYSKLLVVDRLSFAKPTDILTFLWRIALSSE